MALREERLKQTPEERVADILKKDRTARERMKLLNSFQQKGVERKFEGTGTTQTVMNDLKHDRITRDELRRQQRELKVKQKEDEL